MRKPKIYLDTTVISFYYAEDAPEKMAATRAFFDKEVASGNYEIYISAVVLEEIERCSNEKQVKLDKIIVKADVTILETTSEVESLAEQLIKEGVIPLKYDEDAFHIAIAVYYGMDYLASWNYKHIVKVKTKRMVSSIAIREGYRDLEIITPMEVLENED